MKLKLEDLPDHIKKRNPHLFAVGGLRSPEPERSAGRALGDEAQARPRRSRRLEGRDGKLRVVFVVHRRRLVEDRDNLIGGCKPLRDAIAISLGLDDSERFIWWEYHQIKTSGRQGVAVKIEKRT